jgi:hypothetical protein
MKIEHMWFFVLMILLVALFEPAVDVEGARTYLQKAAVNLDILAKLAAALTLIGLLYQISKNRQLKEAEFILNLNEKFIENDRIARIYTLLEKSKNDEQTENPLTKEDIIDMNGTKLSP